MRLRGWLILIVFAFICASPATAAERPNVLLILADDLGYSDLSCYGGEIRTPHIDALAAGGVRMTRMYNSPRCCPSRAALMTGLHPHQAGIGAFATGREGDSPAYLGRLNDRSLHLPLSDS